MGISNIHDALEDPESASVEDIADDEPQHPLEKLRAFEEHGGHWVECMRCGRQWSAVYGDVHVVTEGDGYCDDNPDPESA